MVMAGCATCCATMAAGGVHRPLVVILALGALDVVPYWAAVLVAVLLALVELAAAGAYVARMSGAGMLVALASAATAVALGGAVVLLKVLVH